MGFLLQNFSKMVEGQLLIMGLQQLATFSTCVLGFAY
jgi:hypothetical protein